MTSLRELRKRIHSIENIKQITRSMEMVAAARLPKAVIKARHHETYVNYLHDIIQQLMKSCQSGNSWCLQRNVKKTGFIIVGADKGMSGSYNSHLFSQVEKKLKKYKPEEVLLFLFGKKAIDYFKRKKWEVKEAVENWGGKITSGEVEIFSEIVNELYLKEQVDEVILVYTQYINAFSSQIQFEKLLHFEKKEVINTNINYIIEPSAEELFSVLLPKYCAIKLESVLSQAYASELSSRVFAMNAATKNAKDMIDKLTIIRNKVRQTNITSEMLEIAAGAEGE